MKIYFEHKESKTRLSMDDLKQNIDKTIQVMPVTFAKMINEESPILEEPLTYRTYKANNIPFHEDWECKIIDNSFTKRELEILRQSLYYNKDIESNERYDIQDKITERIRNIIKMSL